MYGDIHKLLGRVANASKPIASGCALCVSNSETYRRLTGLIAFNQHASLLLQSEETSSARWRNEVAKFLYQEFVNTSYGLGILKRELLESQCVIIYNEEMKIEANKSFGKFIKLWNDYSTWRAQMRTAPGLCLIVTALPVEFRAVVRRLSCIIAINPIEHTNSCETPLPQDAFLWVMDSKHDEHVFKSKVNGKSKESSERPFALVVEGVVARDNQRARVYVLLLPKYGVQLSQRYVQKVLDKPFRECLVVGVTGRLADNKGIHLGQLLVSKNIFDSELRKSATKAKGGDQWPNSAAPWEYGNPSFLPKNWTPDLHEQPPDGREIDGTGNLIRCGDVVSGSNVVKVAEKRKEMQRVFTTCLGAEMEALGCCMAIGRSANRKVRVIKAFCDNCNGLKNSRWQPYCADIASAYAIDYILDMKR